MNTDEIVVRIADINDKKYAVTISEQMEASAKQRGTGISKRSPASIAQKIQDGKAVIALTKNNEWVGFAYMEIWSKGEFVSNSGMIVNPFYRGRGIAKALKEKVFGLARQIYPLAKIFSITTTAAMMKMNMQLGFEPVIYDALPQENKFWQGCRSCVNYGILKNKKHRNCLCTAMLFTPAIKKHAEKHERKTVSSVN